MISEKRITADDYITKPMYMKMYRNFRIYLGAVSIMSILITLGISALVTLFFNGLFEPAITVLSKLPMLASEAFNHRNNFSSYIFGIYTYSSDCLLGLFILPFYLAAMFFNVFITTALIHMLLETAFCHNIVNAEPCKYFNNAIDESI